MLVAWMDDNHSEAALPINLVDRGRGDNRNIIAVTVERNMNGH